MCPPSRVILCEGCSSPESVSDSNKETVPAHNSQICKVFGKMREKLQIAAGVKARFGDKLWQ